MSLLAMLLLVLFLCSLSMLIGWMMGIDRGRGEGEAMAAYRRHGDPGMERSLDWAAGARSTRSTWRRRP